MQHRIRARRQETKRWRPEDNRQRGGVHRQSTRKMWVPKMDHKEGERTVISEGKTKEKNTEKSKGMVTLPYVKGVTEPIQRILKHHEIARSVRPHQSIRRILVHPNDKLEDTKKTDCAYQIPCKSCNQTYIGETVRTFGTRLDEHNK